jgi:multidrug efflux pump subunit AcrA (membrane-fusion protein)
MKRRDAAMATHDAGKAQFAKLDLQRLDLKIGLLEERAEHLELKSPISGLVVRGDLEKVEGAPLTVGQTLFEIAPLDQMTVELAVPEEDVSHVRADLPVRFSLDAYPGRRWEGALGAVHPRAEQRDHRQVFVAEFNMPNPNQQWKPGMSGRATITGAWRPVGWILFHKAWEKAAMKLGW